MTAVEELQAAKAVLADPEAWTKGTVARDGLGRPVHPANTTAVCWDAGGALTRAGSMTARKPYNLVDARYHLTMVAGRHHGYTEFNDESDTTHADVLNLFDRAIARAQLDTPYRIVR